MGFFWTVTLLVHLSNNNTNYVMNLSFFFIRNNKYLEVFDSKVMHLTPWKLYKCYKINVCALSFLYFVVLYSISKSNNHLGVKFSVIHLVFFFSLKLTFMVWLILLLWFYDEDIFILLLFLIIQIWIFFPVEKQRGTISGFLILSRGSFK